MVGHVAFLMLVSLVVVVGTQTGQNAVCNHQGYQLIEGIFGKEVYFLCIKLVNIGQIPLASESAAILLDPDAAESANTLQAFPLEDFPMAYGYPVHAPHTGSAEGYIGDDNHFYGVLHIGNRTLHADPYGKDNKERKFGPFETGYEDPNSSDISGMPRSRRHHFHAQVIRFTSYALLCFPSSVRRIYYFGIQKVENTFGDFISWLDGSDDLYEDPFSVHFPFRIEERKRVPGIARARVCDLLLLADKEFYDKDANKSLNNAVRRMVHAVAQADIIFRNTDFNEDGIPDNIGFSVKYILVLTSNDTNQRVFGDLLAHKAIDGRQYLMKFARLRRLSEVCLGVAFSGHAFYNRTLGLSFTSLGSGMGGAAGGLCDRRAYGRSFNTLALAHLTQDDEDRVPERIAALTLAHEMGHSFGAHHDDNFPNPECRGFLMGSQSSTAENSRHFEFSICSKRLIASTLNSMSYCLTEENRPYCGNGIVEEGEACDCGMPSSCHRRDPCCTPRAGGALVYEEGTLHVEGCSVAPSALCHPSQGLCCTPQCMYMNLSGSGIDCTTLDQQCNCVNMEDCRCALGGRCLPDGTCHAAECALLGLRECQCHKKGAGGIVSAARMCGTCCQVDDKNGENSVCVGAAFAAKMLQDSGYSLPDEWPDVEYQGPNVTLQVCNNGVCREAALRAWPAGDTCVSRGVVGLCSLTGVCKPRYLTPRSNVYPKVMSMKLPRKKLTASTSIGPTFKSDVFVLILAFVVKRFF